MSGADLSVRAENTMETVETVECSGAGVLRSRCYDRGGDNATCCHIDASVNDQARNSTYYPDGSGKLSYNEADCETNSTIVLTPKMGQTTGDGTQRINLKYGK